MKLKSISNFCIYKIKVSISLVLVNVLFHALIGIAATGAESQSKKCFFRDSVNLTNIQPDENGSYMFRDILIPKEKVYQFDFKMEFLDKMKMVTPHPRGCICGKAENKYCVKLCCERGEFYNEESFSCEKIPENFVLPTNITVHMKNGNVEEVNIFEHFVAQVGLPCDNPGLLSSDIETWMLLESGVLDITNENVLLDTNSYCYTPYQIPDTDKMELWPTSCPISNEATFLLLLNSYGMIISAIFFVLTAVVYLVMKELRGSLRGRLLISYLLPMSIAYIILAFINTSQIQFSASPCMAMGFIGYFCFMSGFLWLGVLAFDIWTSFANTQIKAAWNKNLFLIYSLSVWCTASILLILVIWSQVSSVIPDAFKPGISFEMCWLNTKKWSAAIYFYIPSLVILIFNIVIFTRVIIRIHRERRNVTRLTNKQKFSHENAFYILRLFLIMGISWIMDIISYCFRNFSGSEVIFAVTDFYNAIQGVFVFILLVCNRNVFAMFKTRLNSIKGAKRPPSRAVSMTSLS